MKDDFKKYQDELSKFESSIPNQYPAGPGTLIFNITDQSWDIVKNTSYQLRITTSDFINICILGYALPNSRNIVYCPKCEKALWLKELDYINTGIEEIKCGHCNHTAQYDHTTEKWVVIRKEAAKEAIKQLFDLADKKGLSGYAIAKGCGIAESNVNRIKAGMYLPKLDSYLALKDFIENY